MAAPPEAVWKAITEGEELTRWFCVEATCQPEVGGEQHIDWGGGAKATQKIVIWQPNAHLRTEAVKPERSRPASGEPYAIDWYLETEGGTTRVRMVASGFGEGLIGITSTTAPTTAGTSFTRRSSTTWRIIAARPPTTW